VTGWACEKIAQNVGRTHFLSKLIDNFRRGKNLPKFWIVSVIFKKMCPRVAIAQRAKIRPIWSPFRAFWRQFYDLRLQQGINVMDTIFGEFGLFSANRW
jgi:hypothetical protein